MKLAHGLILTALLAAGPVLAQAQVNRMEFQVPVTPAVGGWASPQTNLGGLIFDVIPDPNRPVVSGSWTYQIDGQFKTFFFQTNMVYSTHAEALQTGIISTFEGPTFDITGRGNYADPVYGGGGSALPTNRTVRFEFESSRVGTFIDNPGQPDERRFPIVASLRGAPLVAPADFAGDWVAISRVEFPAGKRTYIGMVHLSPYDASTNFQVKDVSDVLHLPPANPSAPESGARAYRLSCPVVDRSDESLETPCKAHYGCDSDSCVPGRVTDLLWINPNETGALSVVTEQADTTTLYDYGHTFASVYANSGRILIRDETETSLRETELVRLPTGLFEWPQPFQCPAPLPPDCQTY